MHSSRLPGPEFACHVLVTHPSRTAGRPVFRVRVSTLEVGGPIQYLLFCWEI